jgi:N-acetylglucosaminyldiphosphoundecaprenol N-acetyl-beta-D-mannosaminyltransferase
MDGALPLTTATAPAAEAARPQRLRLLGGEVDLVTPCDVLDFTAGRIRRRRHGVVANHNLHSLHLLRRNPQMARFYAAADLIEADSTPLIAWGRLLGMPIGREHRCTYLDWREAFWARAAKEGWRVFYLGGEPGVAARGAQAIRARWPEAMIGSRHGRFDMQGAENSAVLGEIADFAPDVLFVGMGMPRQEAWIAANLERLAPCVAFSVGAAFDYEAGAQPTPPRWTGRLGLEWLFRLLAEPRRLAFRYLVEPWSLIAPAMADLARALRRKS